MSLQFITETSIGPKERRLIRSHVMKGKNAGRKLRRVTIPKRKSQSSSRGADLKPVEPVIPHTDRLAQSRSAYHTHILYLDRIMWNDFSLTVFPVTGDTNVQRIIYQGFWHLSKMLYPSEFCKDLNLGSYVWFHLARADPAYLHAILAISTSYSDKFGGTVSVTPSALSHMSQAYNMLKERMSHDESASNTNIAIVTVFSIYQRMHKMQSTGLIHLSGLQQMITLRGGLAELAKSDRCLAGKPWRLALEYSLQDGAPVGFDLNDIPAILVTIAKDRSALSMAAFYGLNQDLLEIASDILDFTRFLNNINQEERLEPVDYSDLVSLQVHRLLELASLAAHNNPFDKLVHVSLIAVMATLMPEYAMQRQRYGLLADQLTSALSSYAFMVERNQKLFLWALLVAGVTVLDEDQVSRLLPVLRDTCGKLSIGTWEDILSILKQFPWIEMMYNTRAQFLWEHINK